MSGSRDEASMEVPDLHPLSYTPSKDLSSFSQVVFPEISDCFPPGKDVKVTYVLTEALQPSSRDWIGLFQVGWTSAREYFTFVWAPKASNPGDSTVTATFSAYYLPKDNNEFYQFCYVTRQGHVRGASTPFQFRVPLDCDQLVEVEDESGMILLKTKSTVLEEQVTRLTEEKALLEKKLEELEQNVAKYRDELSAATSEMESKEQEKCEVEAKCDLLEKEIADTVEKLNDVTAKLTSSEAVIAAQKDELSGNVAEIVKLEEEERRLADELVNVKAEKEKQVFLLNGIVEDKDNKLVELENIVRDLRENLQQKAQESAQKTDVMKERDDAKLKALRGEEEKNLYKDQLAISEEARQALVHQLDVIKKEIAVLKEDIFSKASKLAAYETKTGMLRNALKEAEKQNVVQKSVIDSQLSNIEDKLNACEASKRLISEELTEARDHRDRLMSELHAVKKEKDLLTREVDEARQRLGEMEKNCAEILEQSERSEQRYMEKEKKLNEGKEAARERENALKQTIEILTCQLESANMTVAAATSSDGEEKSESGTQTGRKSTAEQENDESSAEECDTIASLNAQIEDLSTRLSMGAAAYTEKYMECHKLKRKMKKMHSPKSPPKTATANLDEDSTTTDSQDDSTRGVIKTPEKEPPPVKQEETLTGGNFMSRLEQLFMSIADPDVEEQEKANRVRIRMEGLEKNVEFQHEKYKKYKKRYHDEKESHAADHEKFAREVLHLKCEVDDVMKANDFLQHENVSLKNQLEQLGNGALVERWDEFMRWTDHQAFTPRNPLTAPTIPRHGYPHQNPPACPALGYDPESDSDLSDECDIDHSNCTGAIAMRRPLPNHGDVINRQPTRSPPALEIVSGPVQGYYPALPAGEPAWEPNSSLGNQHQTTGSWLMRNRSQHL